MQDRPTSLFIRTDEFKFYNKDKSNEILSFFAIIIFIGQYYVCAKSLFAPRSTSLLRYFSWNAFFGRGNVVDVPPPVPSFPAGFYFCICQAHRPSFPMTEGFFVQVSSSYLPYIPDPSMPALQRRKCLMLWVIQLKALSIYRDPFRHQQLFRSG